MPEAGSPLLLALNVGSSSLRAKLYVIEEPTLRLESTARLDGVGRRHARLHVDDVGFSVGAVADHARAADLLLERMVPGSRGVANRLLAFGHRIVHGGCDKPLVIRVINDR
jgi:acetate kinase